MIALLILTSLALNILLIKQFSSPAVVDGIFKLKLEDTSAAVATVGDEHNDANLHKPPPAVSTIRVEDNNNVNLHEPPPDSNVVYFIVTASVYKKGAIRKEQYKRGILSLIRSLSDTNIAYKIIIVENNGERPTFLDDFGVDVLYTKNNFIQTNNKGVKELRDIHDCIEKHNIPDDSFVVKMTGRYILERDSPFITQIKFRSVLVDCIVRFGSYMSPNNTQSEDCITGLIGMRCKFIKEIEYPVGNEVVEWKWAKKTYDIPLANVIAMDRLGIAICPGSNTYFSV